MLSGNKSGTKSEDLVSDLLVHSYLAKPRDFSNPAIEPKSHVTPQRTKKIFKPSEEDSNQLFNRLQF